MAITKTINLPDYSFTVNPVELQLVSDSYLSNVGSVAVHTITFSAAPATTGQEFNGSCTEGDFAMVSQNTPISEDGAHFRTAGALTLDEWLEAFAEDIGYNYFIGYNYTVTFDTALNTVTITAKEKGAKWLLDIEDLPGSASVAYSGGTDATVQDNFALFADVIDADGKVHRVQGVYLGPFIAATSGRFSFRLEKLLQGLLQMPRPDLSVIDCTLEHNTHIAAFTLRYFEYYGAQPVAKHYYADSDQFYAVAGGLNKVLWPDNTFFDDYEPPVLWLTWQPRTKRMFENQPDVLYFYHLKWDAWNTDGFVRITITYTDASTLVNEALLTFDNTVGKNGTIYIPAGYFQIIDGLADPSKVVEKYTLQAFGYFEDENLLPITEAFTFLYEPDLIPTYTRYVMFRNSFKVWEVLACTGERVQGLEVSGEILETFLPYDYDRMDGEYAMSETDAFEKYTYNTGLLSKAEMLVYLQELLATDDILEVARETDGETDVIETPLTLVRRSVKVLEDMQQKDRYYLTFECRQAYKYAGHGKVVD